MVISIYVASKNKWTEKFFRTFLFLSALHFFLFTASNGDAVTNPAVSKTDQTHYVLVSIPPYKFFVEKIAGSTVKVEMIVPPGGSPHSFEPTAKQILAAGKADIWFRMGEGFESRILPALKSHRPSMQIVDLREGVDLIINNEGCSCCSAHNDCIDPHIWLSPVQTKIQAAAIARTLSTAYPENSKQYQKALETLLKELDDLNSDIANMLRPLKNRTIMVSHPAFAYFCRDYNMKQLSIEFEGKEPTPWQINQVLQEARQANITTVYILEQLIGKGSRLIAKYLGARVVELDILSENYLENMRIMAREFAGKA